MASSPSIVPSFPLVPIPPDLLFLHPFPVASPVSSPVSSAFGLLRAPVSPPGAETLVAPSFVVSPVSPLGAEVLVASSPVDSPVSPSGAVIVAASSLGVSASPSSSPPASLPLRSAAPVSWASKVKSSFLPLSRVASPTVSASGIPSIQAPDSITLVSSTVWKDHLVAYFHGLPPSPAKVFSDLNPIWGKNGNISVRKHSKRSCLIFIPCPILRQWALDVGLWHSGNCSFTVLPWHPSLNLQEMKLVHAPVWVLFKKVPIELWSALGFSTIASAVGFPVHSEFSDIKPYSNGVVKLRVVVELDKPRPSLVHVTDKLGNSVSLPVEFLKLPPKCGGCGDHGHLQLRCPQPAVLNSSPASGFPAFTGIMTRPPSVSAEISLALPLESRPPSPPSGGRNEENLSPAAVGNTLSVESVAEVPIAVSVSAPCSPRLPPLLVRAKSLSALPPLDSDSGQSSSVGWTKVTRKSKVSQVRNRNLMASSGTKKASHLSDSRFAEEEELISAAQAILRKRLVALDGDTGNAAQTSKKHERKKLRQQMYLFASASESVPTLTSNASLSRVPVIGFGSASDGRALPRHAHSY